MKAKKKPHGMKQRIREERKREERIGLAVIVAILSIIILVSGFIINSLLNQPSTNQPVESISEPKAAIVDHLSLTYPNQTFIETATTILKQAGCTVDYYPGEQVTVEFYRHLPTHEYSLIILRVHSTAPYGKLFTSEQYSASKYVYEQLTDQVLKVSFYAETPPFYFGISQFFVMDSMIGNFKNTTIIMMGCNGLKYTVMAEAFIEKGAKVYISWSDSVLASHTDQATTHLLQHLIIQKQPLKQAINTTMKDVGPDPAYNSLLIYYPLEAGDYTIQNIVGNPIASSVEMQHKVFSQKRKTDNL